jgi:hypothetical protein
MAKEAIAIELQTERITMERNASRQNDPKLLSKNQNATKTDLIKIVTKRLQIETKTDLIERVAERWQIDQNLTNYSCQNEARLVTI